MAPRRRNSAPGVRDQVGPLSAQDSNPLAVAVCAELSCLDPAATITAVWPDGDNQFDSRVCVTVQSPYQPTLTYIFGNVTFNLKRVVDLYPLPIKGTAHAIPMSKSCRLSIWQYICAVCVSAAGVAWNDGFGNRHRHLVDHAPPGAERRRRRRRWLRPWICFRDRTPRRPRRRSTSKRPTTCQARPSR